MGHEARILIVCTGNICRSPFIERLLQAQLDEQQPGLPRRILVRSAGTAAVVGSAMDERAAAQLIAHGGDPTGFRARDLTTRLIAESDLVLTATREHRGQVSLMHPKALRRVFTFRDFADLVTHLDEPSHGDESGRVDEPGHLDESGHGDEPGQVAPPNTPVSQANARQWVRELTERAAASRGLHPPLEPAQAEIVDPFRREDEVFVTMAQQISESMPAVVRALSGVRALAG